MAGSVGAQALCLVRRELEAGRTCDQRHLVCVEGADRDRPATLRITTKARPAVVKLRACGHNDRDPVLVQSLDRRQKRLGRFGIGPVEVLDHHDEGSHVLTTGPVLEDLHSSGKRFGRRGSESMRQLERHVTGQFIRRDLLDLGSRRQLRQCVMDEGGLAHAGVTRDQYHRRTARRAVVDGRRHRRQLGQPTDERICRSRGTSGTHGPTVAVRNPARILCKATPVSASVQPVQAVCANFRSAACDT